MSSQRITPGGCKYQVEVKRKNNNEIRIHGSGPKGQPFDLTFKRWGLCADQNYHTRQLGFVMHIGPVQVTVYPTQNGTVRKRSLDHFVDYNWDFSTARFDADDVYHAKCEVYNWSPEGRAMARTSDQ